MLPSIYQHGFAERLVPDALGPRDERVKEHHVPRIEAIHGQARKVRSTRSPALYSRRHFIHDPDRGDSDPNHASAVPHRGKASCLQDVRPSFRSKANVFLHSQLGLSHPGRLPRSLEWSAYGKVNTEVFRQ